MDTSEGAAVVSESTEETVAFEDRCEVCETTELLTPEEAYQAGWDYPPKMGEWGVISPRTCGGCGIDRTLWWALQNNELDTKDPLGWPEHRRRALAQFHREKDEQQ